MTDYPSDDNEDVTFRFENAQRFDGSKNGHYLNNTIIMRKSDGVITQLTGETKNLTIVTFRNWVQYAEMDMSGTITIYAGTEDDPTLWDAVEPQVEVDDVEATITYSCTLPNHSKIRLENLSGYAVYIYTMASAA